MLRNVSPASALRVAVVEDVPLFRQTLQQAIDEDDTVELVACVGTCDEARTVIPSCAPDVVLLDLHLQDGFGFDVGIHLRRVLPELRVVILSEHVRPQVLESLAPEERACWSYLLKTGVSSRAALIGAIHEARRRTIVDSRVRGSQPTAQSLRLALLSDQQRQILALVASGLSNQAIGEAVHLSPKSVEYHLTQIYQTLDVSYDASANPRVRAAVMYSVAEDGAAQPDPRPSRGPSPC